MYSNQAQVVSHKKVAMLAVDKVRPGPWRPGHYVRLFVKNTVLHGVIYDEYMTYMYIYGFIIKMYFLRPTDPQSVILCFTH